MKAHSLPRDVVGIATFAAVVLALTLALNSGVWLTVIMMEIGRAHV